MIKKNLWLLGIILLILNSFVSYADCPPDCEEDDKAYSDMSRNEKQKYLRKELGILGVNPDNVVVSGNSVTIKSGKAGLNKKTKKGLEIIVDGGNINVYRYDGNVKIGAKGGSFQAKNGNFIFGSGGWISC